LAKDSTNHDPARVINISSSRVCPRLPTVSSLRARVTAFGVVCLVLYYFSRAELLSDNTSKAAGM
jgi:hypothetical protein